MFERIESIYMYFCQYLCPGRISIHLAQSVRKVDSIIQPSDNGGLMGAMTTGPMAFNKLSLNTCSAQHSVLFEI